MALDFRELKSRMKPEFHENYGKYYPVESLASIGFSRKVCSKCGRGFWSQSERDFCDEPVCSGGYRFIGEKLARKPFKYKEAWDEYVKVFKRWDYVPIKRYPVVCRWYDELYFVNAGVNDFQPYVVSGEVPPPAGAVLEPQFCLRFSDIDSVGITGRHYTGFIMAGQHTFNTPEKHVYFKDEGILQMHEFLTKGLGIKPAEIFYHEDVWAGGGNFGPSMEFFSRGLELGNQVYMQYEVLPDGSHRELKTKVIDMGAGLERWSWFSQGVPMSYDTVFPKVMEYLYKETAVKPDKIIWNKFARYAGLLAFDEIENAGVVWRDVAKEVGVDLEILKREVYRMRALYAIGDHARTLLVAIHDGALPSNVGGGYNLRNILRRCWTLMDEYDFTFDLNKVFEIHIKEFGKWYTELSEVGSLWDILETEKGRFSEGKKKARAVVSRMISDGESFSTEKLVELYDSQGIHPQTIKEVKPEVTIPDDFYLMVEERHQKKDEKNTVPELKVENIPETKLCYYDEPGKLTFKAKILAIKQVFPYDLVLDKTYFYPEGGGQNPDLGKINGMKVVSVQKAGKVVLHILEGYTGIDNDFKQFKVGAEVICVIDGARRLQLTQHHTATHIINAAANKVLGPHIWQAGAHKSVDMARLDVTHYKAVSDGELREIEQEANRIVAAALPVKKLALPREEAEKRYGFRIYQGGAVPGVELRIIDIAGVDAEACGGTHLDNTSEAGKIKIVKATRIQDGVVRIEFKAGKAACKETSREESLFNEAINSLPVIPKDKVFDSVVLQNAADAVNVQVDKLPQTIERFKREWLDTGTPIELEESDNLAIAMKRLFAGWKKARKKKESTFSSMGGGFSVEIEKSFKSKKTVWHLLQNLTTPVLIKIATEMV
ncbi:MAG: alanine--tRNA ligase, partial [Methanobacteriota archaeon]